MRAQARYGDPKPGGSVCPTCHRSDPPAARNAGARQFRRTPAPAPRRTASSDRIRARRSGGTLPARWDRGRQTGRYEPAIDPPTPRLEAPTPGPIRARTNSTRAAAAGAPDRQGVTVDGRLGGHPPRRRGCSSPPGDEWAPPPSEGRWTMLTARYVDNFDDAAYDQEPYRTVRRFQEPASAVPAWRRGHPGLPRLGGPRHARWRVMAGISAPALARRGGR